MILSKRRMRPEKIVLAQAEIAFRNALLKKEIAARRACPELRDQKVCLCIGFVSTRWNVNQKNLSQSKKSNHFDSLCVLIRYEIQRMCKKLNEKERKYANQWRQFESRNSNKVIQITVQEFNQQLFIVVLSKVLLFQK